MKRILAPAMALVGLSALSGMAYGQAVVLTSNTYSWGGFYAGVNAGGVFNRTCANWTPYVNGVPVTDYVLNNCPNNSEFTGGAQLGYNFAFNQIVLGLEADYNGWSSKSKTRKVTYTGVILPPGTYTFSGKESPNGGGTVRLRFGYAMEQWLPYVTGGFAYASGSPTTAIYFTPAGTTNTEVLSSKTRTLNANGWTAGAGLEYGVMTNLSVKVEYLYLQFGHASKSVGGACTGPGCDFAPGTTFTSHNSGEVNMARLGVNWLFGGP